MNIQSEFNLNFNKKLRTLTHGQPDRFRLSVFKVDSIRPSSLLFGAVTVNGHVCVDTHRYPIQSCLLKKIGLEGTRM